MKRGEIWVGSGSNYVSKPRPVVIIQDDAYGELNSMTVVPITSVLADASLLRVPLASSKASGLRAPSAAMIDKISTLRREHLVSSIGMITQVELRAIEQGLAVFLGLAR